MSASQSSEPSATAPHRKQGRLELAGRVLEWIVLGALGLLVIDLMLPKLSHPREAGFRSRCKNNLKQLGMALENYHDLHGSFPPAYFADGKGRPMHSWRVLILPHLEQQSLYDEYRFDEPWDGPNNRKLADRIVDAYRCPSDDSSKSRNSTNYLAVIGPETAWPGARSIKTADFKDPRYKTILLVEVANSGIHWMEPRDLHVSQMAPTINDKAGQGISSKHWGGVQVLFGDGAVRFLSDKLPRTKLEAFLTIRGGENVEFDF